MGNPSAFKARMQLVIAWKACEVISEHTLNQKSPLNLKRIEDVQVQTCFCTSESNGSLHVVCGNPSGFNARMGLMIAWKVSQIDRFALLLGIRVDLLLELDS
ncbi:uncharacterized protein G2W53_004313 [Senna tora]|uniref:Uncharacterized protein n=1 Tax=Senna tora TaxID=362788 RepID=A0A834XCK7_9FABA|nr:uncharacterized protein G2W53_004313 [Senna tora]